MRYLLFVCNRNAGRPQMAQAFFEDVPVRTHTVTLAVRQTRECLQDDHCDAVAHR